jgi:uncharacterized membrane protein (UPF0127 family)
MKDFLKSLAIVAVFFVSVFLYFNLPNVGRNLPSIKEITTQNNLEDIRQVKIGNVVLKVDLALTPEEQQQGLSGRELLIEDQGMLFVFDTPGRYPFWMKDMNFPIDMIWVSEDNHIVFIKKNATPESYPESFVSLKDAKYVLETVSGFADKNNIKEGDTVEFLFN